MENHKNVGASEVLSVSVRCWLKHVSGLSPCDIYPHPTALHLFPPLAVTHAPSPFPCSSPVREFGGGGGRGHRTSDPRESHPKSAPWIIEEDQVSLTLIIHQSIWPPLSSYNIKCLLGSMQPIRRSRRSWKKNQTWIAPCCLHWRFSDVCNSCV